MKSIHLLEHNQTMFNKAKDIIKQIKLFETKIFAIYYKKKHNIEMIRKKCEEVLKAKFDLN